MHAVSDIEEVIAKSLSELTGKNVRITIGKIDFEFGAWTGTRTKFDVAMDERPVVRDNEADLPDWAKDPQP
ncbi:hypothetical protein BUW96_01335 [Achromobacter insolitus]|nr:hypothetical protein BUW96_01335 [Achromobacter insolitus]OWT54380.1 hypothetical protein CEY08_27480 [Achromobacter insolitus]